MKFITIARTLQRYWKMANDPRTPKAVKFLIVGGLAFTVIPDDWLPEWMAELGLADDAAVIPSVIALSLLMIPKKVREEHAARDEVAIEQGMKSGEHYMEPQTPALAG